MKSTVSLQVGPDTLLKLIARLGARGGPQDLSAAINAAIELWLAEQAKLPARCDPASVRGYQWKSLFLPEGTVLRSWSYGEHNYARVAAGRSVHVADTRRCGDARTDRGIASAGSNASTAAARRGSCTPTFIARHDAGPWLGSSRAAEIPLPA